MFAFEIVEVLNASEGPNVQQMCASAFSVHIVHANIKLYIVLSKKRTIKITIMNLLRHIQYIAQ